MRVIQIGIGGFGEYWLNILRNYDGVEHAAYVDVSDTVIDRAVTQHGIDRALVFPSVDEALKHVQADAVINVTPPALHCTTSVQAMEAGLPVLSEKPLAGSMEDAHTILEASRRTGVLHVVSQNYRYSAAIQTVKRALTEGGLGAINGVTVEFFKGIHFGGFREEMPYPLIIDMAIHHFDLMRFFLEDDPVSVFGRSYNPAWSWFAGDAAANVSFDFVNGAVVSYHGSWVSSGQETPWNGNWRFECEHGVLTLRDDHVYVQRLLSVDPTDVPGRMTTKHSEVEEIALEPVKGNGQEVILERFRQAVMEGGEAPVTTCFDNIKSLSMVFGAVESFESGQPVTLATL